MAPAAMWRALGLLLVVGAAQARRLQDDAGEDGCRRRTQMERSCELVSLLCRPGNKYLAA